MNFVAKLCNAQGIYRPFFDIMDMDTPQIDFLD